MSGKSRKQPYRKSRRFDTSCRCHGSCGYCADNRAFNTRRRECSADEQLASLAEAESDSLRAPRELGEE